jgi:hypothetical protein
MRSKDDMAINEEPFTPDEDAEAAWKGYLKSNVSIRGTDTEYAAFMAGWKAVQEDEAENEAGVGKAVFGPLYPLVFGCFCGSFLLLGAFALMGSAMHWGNGLNQSFDYRLDMALAIFVGAWGLVAMRKGWLD